MDISKPKSKGSKKLTRKLNKQNKKANYYRTQIKTDKGRRLSSPSDFELNLSPLSL
jgi:hypothetical protein